MLSLVRSVLWLGLRSGFGSPVVKEHSPLDLHLAEVEALKNRVDRIIEEVINSIIEQVINSIIEQVINWDLCQLVCLWAHGLARELLADVPMQQAAVSEHIRVTECDVGGHVTSRGRWCGVIAFQKLPHALGASSENTTRCGWVGRGNIFELLAIVLKIDFWDKCWIQTCLRLFIRFVGSH